VNTADLIVAALENEGVEYVFGIPGEENLHLIHALSNSEQIEFILTRHEQAAAFMAEMVGRLTGRAGVCLATLGPGAINLLLGVADAQLDSHPMVAISAQASLDRQHKESHQVVDLVAMFDPIVKWGEMLMVPGAAAEMVRKAFKEAESERQGATALIVPEDIAGVEVEGRPLRVNRPRPTAPSISQVARAVEVIDDARAPIVLAGAGVSREGASLELVRMAERLNLPVATTFLGKGVMPDDHPNALGTIGFMMRDYTNFGFEESDCVIAVGYDPVEYPPARWNPSEDKAIVHVHRSTAEVDVGYQLSVGLQGDLGKNLDALGEAGRRRDPMPCSNTPARRLLAEELESGASDDRFPLAPARIVSDIRSAMGREDILLCDTGALKMWLARLYPTYAPETCMISNGLATMAFTLPGAIAAKMLRPERKVMATMGDGAFMMNSQEIETAVRHGIDITILIWEDGGFGLIGWKQELEMKRQAHVGFSNPDFVRYAEAYGAVGHAVTSADQLLPMLRTALDEPAVSVVTCPVDYSANAELTAKLGALTAAL
jgi:acetolactate synthase-1/2/3 large subunit